MSWSIFIHVNELKPKTRPRHVGEEGVMRIVRRRRKLLEEQDGEGDTVDIDCKVSSMPPVAKESCFTTADKSDCVEEGIDGLDMTISW
jgi:hypothetical protein